QEMEAGNITPTHLVSVVSKTPAARTRYHGRLSPGRCLRYPARGTLVVSNHPDAEGWSSWPYADREALQTGYDRLRDLQDRYNDQEAILNARTQWAQALDHRIAEAERRISELQRETDAKTEW